MRIAIDIRSLVEPNPSGVSEYTSHIVSELVQSESKHEFVLFSNAVHPIPRERLDPLRADCARVVERAIPNKLLNTSLALLSFPPLDRVVGGADLFFLPNMNFFSCTDSCKLVLTVHDVSFCHQGFYGLKQRIWHRAVRFKKLLKRAERIITVSESTSRDLQCSFGVPADSIEIIRLGVDRERFRPCSSDVLEEVRHRYGLPGSYILSLGAVGPRKNTEGFIRAWNHARQAHNLQYKLVIAGSMHSTGLPKHHRDVLFTGYVADKDKPALYQGARLFAYPSYYEGFGLPVYEAMASGVPVLTSFSTSLPEIARDAAILADPYNISEMSRALSILATDEALRRLCVIKGNAAVETATWPSAGAQTLSLFDSLQ
ncbi:MAG: glycosyltransferase family 1 protein [Patescibacteria group bacterium]|nr:glycosyltransferase family 1 protein [Patescibacteria group bacterium]MDD5715168.1 glycosyltransferase family 1 protein [Patescibacteria group bacterium]